MQRKIYLFIYLFKEDNYMQESYSRKQSYTVKELKSTFQENFGIIKLVEM